MTTRDEAIAATGACLAEARALRDSLPVAEAARIAWTPTGPSLAELEQQITAMRGSTDSRSRRRDPRAAAGAGTNPRRKTA